MRDAQAYGVPVWVVIDGSTDGSADSLLRNSNLRLIVLPENRGKGGAVLEGLRLADGQGFTHVLTMDADGQHPAGQIPEMIALSRANPAAMILGRPVFAADAPFERVWCRKLAKSSVKASGRRYWRLPLRLSRLSHRAFAACYGGNAGHAPVRF